MLSLSLRGGLFSIGFILAACTTGTETSSPAPAPSDPGADAPPEVPADPSPLIVARPYVLRAPADYDDATPAPLVIELHGYGEGDNATTIEKWMKLAPVASKRGYLLAIPSGTKDRSGYPAWNATDACCDFDKRGVDDVAYFAALIDDVARTYNLDRKRVFVTGISGGAFMAHRLACDLSEKIAGVFSISGATWEDASRCKPTSPVALVELHGDKDDVVPYAGGPAPLSDATLPSAETTVQRWATYNGCTGALRERGRLDLETAVDGAETKVEAYDGCPAGAAELWTAEGGPHASEFTPQFGPTLFDFFDAHPKP
jgi:polyhydroxybutyrate depolymerase